MFIHCRQLHALFCGIFGPHSVNVARYASFIWAKSPTNCDTYLTESNFQTCSNNKENNKNRTGRKGTMHLVYLKLELKRAYKRLPHIYAGAILLLAMAAVIALLASQLLYGNGVVGKVPVGVLIPNEDRLAKQVVQMISSLDSVGNVCDFQYMDKNSCLEELKKGNLYAVLDVPEGFVQDIINGTNTPVTVWFTSNAGIEGKLFQELTDAGALTLSASQAGIYAGNELYQGLGLKEAVSQLEKDLNEQYIGYSLQRTGYFRHLKVQASGDVTIMEFYEISVYVLFLFLLAIPVSSYLLPAKKAMTQRLDMAGIGGGYRAAVKMIGLGLLIATVTFPVIIGAVLGKQVKWSMILAVTWLLACGTASGIVVLLYQLTGNLLGGIMLLFFVITGQHFLSGGFLPMVFLPATIQKLSIWLPSSILMNTMKMAITEQWDWHQIAACVGLLTAVWAISGRMEARRR